MAAPMPPLPPVTRARTDDSFMAEPRGMLRQVAASNTAVARPVTRRCASDRNSNSYSALPGSPATKCGFADEIGFDVIEPQHMQPHIAHGGEKSGLGARGRSPRRRQARRERHGLSGIFNSAANSQAAVRAQRMIGRTMSGAAAADMLRVPLDDFIEQAHASVMGNVLLRSRYGSRAWFDSHFQP